jgi:carboxypeptidase family protein
MCSKRLSLGIGLLALAIVCAGARLGYGQLLTGTLTGIVNDTSGAVVPGATVIMTDQQSGAERRTVSNAEGYFTIAAVPTGSYTVTVEAQGFQKWQTKDLHFDPGDKRNLSDIQLKIGQMTEAVTVSATPEMVSVDSGEKSAVISAQQLQNLQVVGRSAAELIKILPGMAPTSDGLTNRPAFTGEAIGINGNGDGGHQSALGYYSANGTRTSAMDIVADGAHVSDPGCNCATPVNPDPDMIQEFKVLQGNYSAENAKGPIVLDSSAKAGTKDFHGEGYFYFRDYRLNANDWLLNSVNQPRPKNKYRFPGGNIGGPVLIPHSNFNKNHDKLFFFTGYEYFQQTIDTGVLQAVVPTQAMLGGDFSDSAYLSALGNGGVQSAPTGTGITGGMVPSSMIDPGGIVLMKLMPAPNVDPATIGKGFNYVQALTLDQPMHQWQTRVDYSISDNTKLFVRYNLQRETQNFPVGLWWRNSGQVPYPTPVVAKNRSDSISTSLTHVFNPTLTNEFIFGLTYIDFPNAFQDPKKVSRSALGYPYKGVYKNGLDQIPSFTDWSNLGTVFNPGGFDPILFARKWEPSVSDNLSKVAGTHTMKFGFYWETVTNNQPGNDYSNGLIQYANWIGNSTGNAFADLLTGRIAGYTDATKNILHDIWFRDAEFYAQDSWKATPRLTLEYGARFAHLGNWYDHQNIGMAVFNASKYSNDPTVFNLLTNQGTGLDWHKVDPSIPLSGAPSRSLFVTPRIGAAYDLFGTGKTVLRGGFGAFRYHDPQGPFPGALDIAAGHQSFSFCCGTTLLAVDALVPSAQKTSITVIDARDDQQPVNYNWNVTVSQRLPGSIIWETSYVGNKSSNLTNDGISNIDTIPLGTIQAPFTGNDSTFRPFQNYNNSISVISHTFYQNYHALQTQVSRQRGRINITANYTYSKTMGIRGSGQGSVGDQLNFRNDYGPLAYDRTHLFNIAYVIQLPDPAKSWNGSGSRLARGVLDGWQLSGITQFASGLNLQAANGNSNFNLATTTGKLADGTPFNSDNLLGTPDVSLQPIVTCNPSAGLGTNQFINGNCFALPSIGHNGSMIIPYLRGPGYQDHDISVFKNWSFTETRKLQFRLAAYNVFNHPLTTFTNGDPNLNLTFNTDGTLANKNFGIADNKVGRRILQMAIKFYF